MSNDLLSELRDRLAEKIEVEHGLTVGDDVHYVRWEEIENTLDELGTSNQ